MKMLKNLRRGLWNYHTVCLVILTPLLLLPLPLVIGTQEAKCAFVLLLMATFWVTEVIPLSMTAMLPAILFPMFGIMKSSSVAKEYFKDFHFLLVGIICLATSIEKWGLHRRIALRLVTMVGVNPAWLILGFMSGCAFLSMWVQNTSAVTMVMPIVEAVLQQILKAKEECAGEHNLALQLDGTLICSLLSFIYCLIPKITQLRRRWMYPNCDSINFGNWLLLCLPISIIMLLLTWIWLYWLFIGSDFSFMCRRGGEQSAKEKAAQKVLDDEYKSLGPMSSQEIFTGVVFMVMVLLWLTRSPGFMPGWAALFPNQSGYITDATVAVLLGFLFFIVPLIKLEGRHFCKDTIFISLPPEAMICWQEFQASMPWKVALLVGGGFALAEGTKESGLSLWVAELLTPLGELPVLATISIACIIVTTVTEVASNAATATIFLPILSPLAEAIHVNPLYVLIPTTLCTSFSFLLPVSNPPNAVVFAYGHITIMDMVKAGLGANVIGILAILLAIATWGVPLFSLNTYPHWAPVLPGFNSTTP
uniref:Solute carrier family 13 member 1 n=1 Tax=Anabas testudineus TaxID=64144 RepID=A0A7N6B5D1_ANATE